MDRLLTPAEFNTIRAYLKDSITLMDERGRRNKTDKGYLLWHHEWRELRDNLYFALEVLDDVIESDNVS